MAGIISRVELRFRWSVLVWVLHWVYHGFGIVWGMRSYSWVAQYWAFLEMWVACSSIITNGSGMLFNLKKLQLNLSSLLPLASSPLSSPNSSPIRLKVFIISNPVYCNKKLNKCIYDIDPALHIHSISMIYNN